MTRNLPLLLLAFTAALTGGVVALWSNALDGAQVALIMIAAIVIFAASSLAVRRRNVIHPAIIYTVGCVPVAFTGPAQWLGNVGGVPLPRGAVAEIGLARIAALTAALGVLSFVAAAHSFPLARVVRFQVDARRLERGIVVMLLVGLGARAYLIQVKGGLSYYISNIGVRGLNNTGLGPLWLATRLSVVAVVALVALATLGRRPSRLTLTLAVLTLPTVLLLNQRGGVLFIGLASMGVLFLTRPSSVTRRAVVRLRTMLPVVLVLAALVAWGEGRSTLGSDRPRLSLTLDNSLAEVSDYYLEAAALKDAKWHWHPGAIILRAPFTVVPRALWPTKPRTLGHGAMFTDAYYPWLFGKNTLTSGNAGAWYLDFGWLGVVGGPAMFALALSALARGAQRGSPLWFGIFATVFGHLAQVHQGGVPEVIGGTVQLGAVLALLMAWSRLRAIPPTPLSEDRFHRSKVAR